MGYLQSEIYSYEYILADMLSRIPDDLDKREGSIIYNALAPAAIKLAEAYFILDNNLDLSFLDTATEEYLTRKCLEHGIARREATSAIRKGTFKDSTDSLIDVAIGERFRIEDITFIATEKISLGTFKLQCEQLGAIGNKYLGILLPLGNLTDVATATLGEILIYGEDTESDESLRTRTKTAISNSETDGNINQYLRWANDFNGIGRSKVFPLANGPNTVKVSITDSKNQVASSSLIKSFQDYLDPSSTGLGNGKAPIGSKVTVTTGTSKVIDVRGEVNLNSGYSQAEGAKEIIIGYLSSISYAQNKVSYIKLASEILSLPSVADVRNITLNNGTSDISLGDEEIPTLGALELAVVS
ncbi:baseplate J/gp47 family protein [Clostridium sp.]|uniref:baseplate J/gp47 family protein n=1 Tax=Clostridium sp. TaxID=1506 RepID=UPI003217E721